ncbi:hypothetical protein BDR26DRAFT_296205 [Obelidium mucronatum]|nr:hypothetical protein BDR26DRAFT_296205 [Obelidium mucronatum]
MKITISSSVKRFAILCVSVFCMIGSGSVFAFSVVASQLQTAFSYNSSDLNVVSGVGFAALYLPFLFIGPIYDAAWSAVDIGVGNCDLFGRIHAHLGGIRRYDNWISSCRSLCITFLLELVQQPPIWQ